jgi:hypothetical protein
MPHGSGIYYRAEDIVNWRTEDLGGVETFVLVALREAYDLATEDEFSSEPAFRYRRLRMTLEGVYTQQVYTPVKKGNKVEWVPGEVIIPQRQGQALLEIHFVFVGPNNVMPSVDHPPFEDLVDVNLSHFRTSADLADGRH